MVEGARGGRELLVCGRLSGDMLLDAIEGWVEPDPSHVPVAYQRVGTSREGVPESEAIELYTIQVSFY